MISIKKSDYIKRLIKTSIDTSLSFVKKSVFPFLKVNWRGTLVILAAVIVFFWPIIVHIGSYSEGGDSMFNAWTLARDQHCILNQGCPNYSDGNIFFPHANSMLYSETQLAAGFLTLPLHFINQNPLFSSNVWTIMSYFFMGWFMYLLAKYLSKGNELVSIVSGLIFAFAPFQMAAIWHLQNLSIFYVPLAVLMLLRYFDTSRRKYLVGVFIPLTLLCYSSWYQMIFGVSILGLIIVSSYIFKNIKLKQASLAAATVVISLLMVMPLALKYINFSKTNSASFGISDQLLYSSSLQDYIIPHNGTIAGKAYYKINPGTQVNAYNLDSFSYHGIVMYAIGLTVLITAVIYRKSKLEKSKTRLVYSFVAIGIVGFVASLGPLLQIKGSYFYSSIPGGLKISILAPYGVIDKFLPQIHFIRAVGRWSVLLLFALCCLLALSINYLAKFKLSRYKYMAIVGAALVIIFVELAPIHLVPTNHEKYASSFNIPAVYTYIKNDKQIDNIIVIDGDSDYPNAKIPIEQAEWVLWAGYDNKNTFNGYSGYVPPGYNDQYLYFKDNLNLESVSKMKSIGLRYLLIDKQLSTTRPELIQNAKDISSLKLVFTDTRYDLYKIN